MRQSVHSMADASSTAAPWELAVIIGALGGIVCVSKPGPGNLVLVLCTLATGETRVRSSLMLLVVVLASLH